LLYIQKYTGRKYPQNEYLPISEKWHSQNFYFLLFYFQNSLQCKKKFTTSGKSYCHNLSICPNHRASSTPAMSHRNRIQATHGILSFLSCHVLLKHKKTGDIHFIFKMFNFILIYNTRGFYCDKICICA
jgi:hypothetical protein